MSLMISPWPFMTWGMDIVSPLPTAPAQKHFMLALTDYFTKWIAVEAYASIKHKDVRMSIWKHIICQSFMPKEIVRDNESQFINNEFREFCEYLKIQLSFFDVKVPLKY